MNRIQIDTHIHFGQPCIAGTRIPIYCVLELVQEGIPFETIVREYYPDINPDITIDDVKACVEYAVGLVKAEEVHLAAQEAPNALHG